MEKYGYVRVSSKEQNPARQIQAMEEAGIKSGNMFVDKISGKTFQRPAYYELLGKLKEGDSFPLAGGFRGLFLITP